MKKIKLMLVSFCVLGAVGGALAFKVKGSTEFCTAPTQSTNPTLACPSTLACPNDNQKLLASTNGAFICTVATSGDEDAPCKVNNITKNCGTTSAQFIIEP